MIKSPKFSWFLRILVALILLQTLFFKFSGAVESVFIFRTLGVEPYGRIGAGIVELIAVVLIIVPQTKTIGAFLGFGLMVAAIGAHVLFLGIELQNDGGLLFFMAVIVLICCALLLYINKSVMRNALLIKN
ncbi:DoxX family protein [Flavobacterium sp. F-392]|uniref:DoxX family protein n=1 Tax=Flavobacterium muglaense TaxID=2764716 RepID=A0A923SGX5_9FLAO|nr:DoxX family protein [Flavobacterium muglaense]MBC5846055.1 DoxX family protein [Flavobacterium muglaense]